MKNKSLIIALLIINSYQIFSQSRMEKIARAGGQGVYVYNGFKLASANMPDAEGGVKIGVQRKEVGQSNWVEIGAFEGPSSVFDLSKKYQKNSHLVLDESFLSPNLVGEVWEKIQKYKGYDSTNYYDGDQVMLMSIGRLLLDTTVVKGRKYEYQFQRITARGDKKIIGLSNLVNYPETNLLAKPKLKKREAEQDRVTITWFLKRGKKPAYFKVYRRTSGIGNNWENIMPERKIGQMKPDTFAMQITDMEVAPNQNYDYFIRVADSFGNYAVNSDTASLVTYKYQDVNLPYRFRTKSIDSLQAIQLHWNVKEKALMAGLEVYRSKDYDKDYKLIGRSSIADTTFLDRDVEPMVTYYYYLQVVDQVGRNSVRTVRAYGNLTDGEKPMSPRRVKAEKTKLGTRISWKKSEPFVENFYVYRGTGIGGKMLLISPLLFSKDSIPSFTDTTSRLNARYQYGYAVRAVSTSHKESAMSDTVYIQPDAPKMVGSLAVPQNLSAIKASDKLVTLFWDDATAMDVNVMGYDVYKKTNNGASFTKLNKNILPASQNHFRDSTFVFGQTAEYQVKSLGSDTKIQSKASASAFIQNKIEGLSAPINLRITQKMTDKSAVINWTKSDDKRVQTVKIYRAEQVANSVPKLLVSLPNSVESYSDKTVEVGKSYFYFLSSTSIGSEESDKSRIVFLLMR
jgi:hypothetical protein